MKRRVQIRYHYTRPRKESLWNQNRRSKLTWHLATGAVKNIAPLPHSGCTTMSPVIWSAWWSVSSCKSSVYYVASVLQECYPRGCQENALKKCLASVPQTCESVCCIWVCSTTYRHPKPLPTCRPLSILVKWQPIQVESIAGEKKYPKHWHIQLQDNDFLSSALRWLRLSSSVLLKAPLAPQGASASCRLRKRQTSTMTQAATSSHSIFTFSTFSLQRTKDINSPFVFLLSTPCS